MNLLKTCRMCLSRVEELPKWGQCEHCVRKTEYRLRLYHGREVGEGSSPLDPRDGWIGSLPGGVNE